MATMIKEKKIHMEEDKFLYQKSHNITCKDCYGSRYSRMNQVKLWKTVFKNFKVIWSALPKQTISLQSFKRLSSMNFTWSILEYLEPYVWFYLDFIDTLRIRQNCEDMIINLIQKRSQRINRISYEINARLCYNLCLPKSDSVIIMKEKPL